MGEKMVLKPYQVAAYRGTSTYPTASPFHPSTRFPEYPFEPIANESNSVYEAVRQTFYLSGLDREHFGTPEWNPLVDLIHPGETVLLKPNLVKETHPRDPNGWQYTITHGSIIRAVSDYVFLALQGRGKIIIADAPQTDSSFTKMVELLHLDEIQQFYQNRGIAFDLYDLRREEWVNHDGVIVQRNPLPGDPMGNVAYNLADKSEFADHGGAGRYYGADYDDGVVNYHHSGGRHEYLIAGSAIKCDVIFSIPKLKTHKKAGITVTLKNLVGINGDKNWLPHHTEGSPATGGDEKPNDTLKNRLERSTVRFLRRLALQMPFVGNRLLRVARKVGTGVFGDTEAVIRSGNWWGNDTIWRMCLDLNKIILYGNPDGTFREPGFSYQKRHFSLVDGIVAGQGNGPMNPDPIAAGLLVFGIHPASVDAACAILMGFNPESLPIVRNAFGTRGFPLTEWEWEDIELVSNVSAWNTTLANVSFSDILQFEPHFAWMGHIERQPAEPNTVIDETSPSKPQNG